MVIKNNSSTLNKFQIFGKIIMFYKKQFEILAEAIAENKKIEETKGYGELHKGRCAKQRTPSSLLISKRL